MIRVGLLFLLDMLLVASLALVSYAHGVRSRPPPPPISVQVDTVYSPPPGYSELFSVECRWVRDRENINP